MRTQHKAPAEDGLRFGSARLRRSLLPGPIEKEHIMVKMRRWRRWSKQLLWALAVALASVFVTGGAVNAAAANLPTGVTVIRSTVPPNGDVNPYGLVEVPATVGNLTAGHLLV